VKRIVIGPFNRVEGDLEVTLDVLNGVVREARVSANLYRGFEQILVGRPSEDALAIAPRICGICSVSQSLAVAAMLRAAQHATPPRNGFLLTNIAHAAENIADHLTHFYLFFMPDFARGTYGGRPWHEAIAARFKATRGSGARDALPARARLLEIMGIIAGKWPHSLAFRPGGVAHAIDLGEKMRLLAILAEFRAFLERVLFDASLEAVTTFSSMADLERFVEGAGQAGDFATFVRIARELGLESLGFGPGLMMSGGAYLGPEGPLLQAGVFDARRGALRGFDLAEAREDASHSFLRDSDPEPAKAQTIPALDRSGAYSFAKAPRLSGEPVEVGALARQAVAGHPLIRDLLARAGASNVFARVVARLLEIALLTQEAEAWVQRIELKEKFCSPDAPAQDGRAFGCVEAARGTLAHWASLRDDRYTAYQIIAPTTWNFSPRDAADRPGPLEFALQGLPVGEEGATNVAVQHIVRSFDPCMVCTAH
jgi:Ni,Fe-hydrogenase I large subunit